MTFILNPKQKLVELEAALVKTVEAREVERALTEFDELLRVYRLAKMDWSHTLAQLGPLLCPLGAALLGPLEQRLDADEALVRNDTGPRWTGSKPVETDGEKARFRLAALRVALAYALVKNHPDGPFDSRFDRHFLPEPVRLFDGGSAANGGRLHDFIARFLGALNKAQVFSHLPDARALPFIAAWRAFEPGKNLELNLKGLFPRRAALLKASPAPALADRVHTLASATGLPCETPIYLLAPGKSASLNRVGGRPAGLPDARWPRQGSLKFSPVLTLDLETVPELAATLPGTRALCLFVDDPRGGFDAAQVVRLAPDECARGITGGKPFTATRVLVPQQVFASASVTGPLFTLQQALRALEARALGRPFLLQERASGDTAGDFVLEARAGFTGLNLGDGGKLFMSVDDATWESL